LISARRAWVPLAGLVASAATLACGHVFARMAFANGVNVLTAATVRSVFAAGLLFLMLRLRGTPILPLTREGRLALLLGIFVAGQTALVQAAVLLMPVTLAILVFYTYPFLVGVSTSLLGTDRLTPVLFFALVAAFGGLALVLGIGRESVSLLGVLAGLGASVCFTVALVLTPRVAPTLNAPLRTFLMISVAAGIFVAAAVATRDFHLPTDRIAQIGLAGLTICYTVGIILLFLFLQALGAAQTAVILNTEPVFVALVAWAVLGEGLSPLQVLGGVVVVGAVMGYQVARAKQPRRVG
jgi:drug/metabolite transporter (DMT)-like permease